MLPPTFGLPKLRLHLVRQVFELDIHFRVYGKPAAAARVISCGVSFKKLPREGKQKKKKQNHFALETQKNK